MKADERPSGGLVSPSGVAYHFGTSGLSVAVATTVTHPLDVLKVRLQMQLVGQKGPLTGMERLFLEVFKNEGPRFLYLGLTPALTRSVLYGGLRLGLYEPSKNPIELEAIEMDFIVHIRSCVQKAQEVFTRGSLAMFARLGPQTTITFVVCEQLRELVGLKAI